MKKFIGVFVFLLVGVFLCGTAMALPIVTLGVDGNTTPLFVGSVLSSENGTGGINDDPETVQAIIDEWNITYSFQLPDLYEVGVDDPKLVPYLENEDVGNWDVRAISIDLDDTFDYLSFKYAENVDLWYVAGFVGRYTFPSIDSTFSNDLSHYREYAPVPEPATFGLLGIGLIGLSTISRKRVFKP